MAETSFEWAYRFTLRGNALWRGEQGIHLPTKADPNPTKDGVTASTYEALGYKGSVLSMTEDERASIYQHFWDASHSKDVDQAGKPKLAVCHFVTFFNLRPMAATKILQRSCGMDTGVDGLWGPNTLGLVRSCDERTALVRYTGGLIRHYRALVDENPDLAPNLKGWELRVTAIQRELGI